MSKGHNTMSLRKMKRHIAKHKNDMPNKNNKHHRQIESESGINSNSIQIQTQNKDYENAKKELSKSFDDILDINIDPCNTQNYIIVSCIIQLLTYCLNIFMQYNFVQYLSLILIYMFDIFKYRLFRKYSVDNKKIIMFDLMSSNVCTILPMLNIIGYIYFALFVILTIVKMYFSTIFTTVYKKDMTTTFSSLIFCVFDLLNISRSILIIILLVVYKDTCSKILKIITNCCKYSKKSLQKSTS